MFFYVKGANTMIKTIEVTENGKTIKRQLKASALLPRLYRAQFERDMVADMQALGENYQKIAKGGENAQFSALDLTIFENTAWLMMKHAGEDVGESPDEWLDNVDGIFSVYAVMPVIVELWTAGQKTTAKPAKK